NKLANLHQGRSGHSARRDAWTCRLKPRLCRPIRVSQARLMSNRDSVLLLVFLEECESLGCKQIRHHQPAIWTAKCRKGPPQNFLRMCIEPASAVGYRQFLDPAYHSPQSFGGEESGMWIEIRIIWLKRRAHPSV